MTRTRIAAQTLSALMLASSPIVAMAADAGFYVGVSLGQSELDSSAGDIKSALEAAGATGVVASVDNTDLGWKLFGGYQLNQYFGVEVSYVNMGEFTTDATYSTPVGSPVHGSAEGDGGLFSVVGTLPLGEAFAVFGKVGAFVWDVDATASNSFGTLDDNYNGTTLAYGIGANWQFTKSVGIRGELERFKDIGPDEGEDTDVDLYSLGAVFQF